MSKLWQKIVDNVIGKKALAPMVSSLQPASGQFVELNGTVTWMPDNLQSFIVDGYESNDIVYSVITLIMEKIKVAPWGLYQVVDEQALKRYNGFLEKKDWIEAQRWQKKALEPMKNFNRQTGRLNELLKWPNDEDTFNELVAADAGYINIVGNNFMWANMLNAGANQGLPGELWNTPAQYMQIKGTRDFPQRKTGYRLNAGIIKDFTAAEIMHEKLFNPSFNAAGSGLYGMSPLKAARKTVTKNNARNQAGATQLQNNGAAGIAFVDDPVVPATGRESQIDVVERSWKNKYAGPDNYGKVAFSGYKMGYVQVGLSIKDMMTDEGQAIDLRILSNAWGVPSQLLNDAANKTYNNQKEAEKALTSRCALPRLTGTRNNFDRKLHTDWGFKGMNVLADFDMSVYTELQEDQAEKWTWVDKLPVSSKYKLEMMGLDIPDDPNMDVVLIDGNKVPLADVIGGMNDQQLAQVNDELNKAGLRDYLRIAK